MIHKLAIIDPTAKIADNVEIGPYTIIGPDVEIGEGTWIGPHVVIEGSTRIGKDNKIFPFAALGGAPQDKGYTGQLARLEIGDQNIFREYCTVHRGTDTGMGFTRIGNDNFFMAYTHVAHNCRIGNHVVFSNNAQIAGHISVDDYAWLGGIVGIHQFCAVGAHSFIGGGSIVYKDVPPFVMVSGYPAEAHGLNTIGLERRGFTQETISALKRAYKIIFRQSLTLQEAIRELKEMVNVCPEVALLTDFLAKTNRGIVR